MIRNWLQLFRAQTAPATILLVMTCYLLSGGKLFSLFGLGVLIFTMFVHFCSFGHNSLMDYMTGFDKIDPSKKHHPLNTGAIKVDEASKVIHFGMVALFLIAIAITLLHPGNQTKAICGFAIFVIAGACYNVINKYTIFKFVPISLAFTALATWGYFLNSTERTMLATLVFLYIFLTIQYQISFSGELKELEAKEKNLLRTLGAKIENGILNLGVGKYYAIMLKSIQICILILILGIVGAGYLRLFIISVFIGFIILILCEQIIIRKWNRNRELKIMSIMEITTIYLLIIALAPIIGYLEVIVLLLFGIIYFCIVNKMLWKTILRPRV